MSAAVTITPASGSITHLDTVCHIACSGVSNNDATSYSASVYPTEPQITYYFKLAATGEETLKSNVFSTNPDGTADWLGVIVPAAGTWTLTVNATSDDSVIATASVTVA